MPPAQDRRSGRPRLPRSCLRDAVLQPSAAVRSQKLRPQPTKSGGVECEADCATNDIAGGMLLYVGGEIIADPKLAVLEPCERKIERQMKRWRVCRRTARYDRYRPGPRRARRCREIHRSPPASPRCSPLQAASAAAPGNGMSASSPTLVPRHLARAWFCELATGRARSLFSATRVRQQQGPLRREQHSSFAASVWLELPKIARVHAGADRRNRSPQQGRRLWHPIHGSRRDAARHVPQRACNGCYGSSPAVPGGRRHGRSSSISGPSPREARSSPLSRS